MNINRYLRFIWLLFKFKLNKQMIYSYKYWIVLFVDLTCFLIQIATFNVIFGQVDNMNGWNKYQVIFFTGSFVFLDGIYMATYFFGLINLPAKIQNGKMDIYLTKPINTLFFIAFEEINVGALFVSVPGIIMMAFAALHLNIEISLFKLAGYIFLIVMMYILMFDLMVILRSAAFWIIKMDALNEFEDQMVNFSFRIPGVVFQGFNKLLFYVLLPYSLMATIPTQFFTQGLKLKYWVLTILVCLGFSLLTRIMWKLGLKRYGSASS